MLNFTGEPDAVKVACPVRRGTVAKVIDSVAVYPTASGSETQTQAGVEHAPCGYVEGVSGQQRCLDFARVRSSAETALLG